jgi:hypothetical protein
MTDLHTALADLLAHYVRLVESGDAGHWDAEAEPVVKRARAALDAGQAQPVGVLFRGQGGAFRFGPGDNLLALYALPPGEHALYTSPQASQPVAPAGWRDHVEQRLRSWRQSFVNKSGDQLALDDFMDEPSIDDLIDFVCDEWAEPAALSAAPPAPAARPVTGPQAITLWHQNRDAHGRRSAFEWFCAGICAA